jgi:AcrR family transcriptional regulator
MTAPPPVPPTAPRGRQLDAALAVLADDGVEGLTLRAIARRANVSHGAPLKHFPHRAALLSAVATTGFRELTSQGLQEVARCPADASAAQRLRACARAYVAYALAHPAMFQLMFRHDLLDPTDRELSRVSLSTFDGGMAARVREAQKEGWRQGDDTRLLTGALWSGLHGLAQLWMWGSLPLATGADDVDDALEALLRALGLNDVSPEGH